MNQSAILSNIFGFLVVVLVEEVLVVVVMAAHVSGSTY
jgi:hypothetical protein